MASACCDLVGRDLERPGIPFAKRMEHMKIRHERRELLAECPRTKVPKVVLPMKPMEDLGGVGLQKFCAGITNLAGFCDVDRAILSCERIEIFKEAAMNRAVPIRRQFTGDASNEKLLELHPDDVRFDARERTRVTDIEMVS